MRVCGLLNYRCIKCSSPVQLEIRTNMQETTLRLWRDMFDAKLCLDCHCNNGVHKLVECLIN
jgi:hypothetical protein